MLSAVQTKGHVCYKAAESVLCANSMFWEKGQLTYVIVLVVLGFACLLQLLLPSGHRRIAACLESIHREVSCKYHWCFLT